jgi:peptide deformylase
MRVCIAGEDVLRRRSKPVRAITDEVRDLAERMIVTMFEGETRGVGLAAPQVGVNVRLITVATQDDPFDLPPDASPGERVLGPRMPIALVNPEIVSASDVYSACSEGCLSIPGVNGDVVRPDSVVVRATLLDGEAIELDCGGLLGRCIQHEIDHLDGVLFTDRLDDEGKRRVSGQLKVLAKQARQQRKRERR